jgi:hypothetical protein
MAVIRTIKTFIKDPEPTAKYDEVETGLNVVEGIARVPNPLRSPVRGQNCVAFFYRSYLLVGGARSPQLIPHMLKEARVFAQFELEMDGGVLKVTPAKPGKFEQKDHMELGRRYGKEFQGTEDVILPGARVRLRGHAKRIDGELIFKMKDIEVIDKQAVAAGVVGDRKQRKKKKK